MVPTPDSFQRELARLFDPDAAPAGPTPAAWWAERGRSPSSLDELPITRRREEGSLPPPVRPPGDLRTAITALSAEAPRLERVHELASRLSSRAAWELGGAEAIAWLLRHDARAELVELFTLVYAYAPTSPDGGAMILVAMHEAFARALLGELESGRDPGRALRALVAIAIPPRLSGRVRRAAREHGQASEHAPLARGLARRARRGATGEPTLDALVAAVHLLVPEPAP